MTVAYPIAHAMISAGGTGAQNYDEFASVAEITEIIAANPRSALAIEMPHCAPDAGGASFVDSLPQAVQRLQRLIDDGELRPMLDVAVLYRIAGEDAAAYGLWCMVPTDEISAEAGEPGHVIRNEDVFIAKVHERVALAEAIGHLLSPVLLLQTATDGPLQEALVAAAGTLGAPAIADVDQAGRTHEIWPIPAGKLQTDLLALAGTGELVVADGNHRSLAAQLAELPHFLAVITTEASVVIAPYNRLISELPTTVAELLDRLRAAGAVVTALTGEPEIPTIGGEIHLYARDGHWAITLPTAEGVPLVDNLDHSLVERVLLRDILGLDPGDKRIGYIGGDYPAAWLATEVDVGRAELAILIAPVSVEDFIAVNVARQKMPRKSTWFTPKARAGLVAAKID